jgi:hypothetical protein
MLIFTEPALKQASDYSLTKILISLFVPLKEWGSTVSLGYIHKIIELLVTQRMYQSPV